MAYADWAYYSGEFRGKMEREEAEARLAEASDAIDALTFSRIAAIGWEGLTPFQQDKVRRACCLQAEFAHANADALESPVESYSINGVSMSFGNSALYTLRGGMPVANVALALVRATGLACGSAFPDEVRA